MSAGDTTSACNLVNLKRQLAQAHATTSCCEGGVPFRVEPSAECLPPMLSVILSRAEVEPRVELVDDPSIRSNSEETNVDAEESEKDEHGQAKRQAHERRRLPDEVQGTWLWRRGRWGSGSGGSGGGSLGVVLLLSSLLRLLQFLQRFVLGRTLGSTSGLGKCHTVGLTPTSDRLRGGHYAAAVKSRNKPGETKKRPMQRCVRVPEGERQRKDTQPDTQHLEETKQSKKSSHGLKKLALVC